MGENEPQLTRTSAGLPLAKLRVNLGAGTSSMGDAELAATAAGDAWNGYVAADMARGQVRNANSAQERRANMVEGGDRAMMPARLVE